MNRFIALAFAFLLLAFFELSGGRSFDPEATGDAVLAARTAREAARSPGLALPELRVTASAAQTAPAAVASEDVVERRPLNLVTFSVASGTADESLAPGTKEDSLASGTADDILASGTANDRPDPVTAQDAPLTGTASLPATLPGVAEAIEPAAAPGAVQSIVFAGNTISSAPRSGGDSEDIRTVKGTRVNMRSGPGTDYDVVDQLEQSTRVVVLSDSGNGWVELRPVDGGPTGWIAAFLLSDG